MEFLEREMPKFISPLLWPPNSPDLSPVDYSVWSILQEKVYKTRITDLDDIKHPVRIRTEWAKQYHAIIAAAVHHWRRRRSAGHAMVISSTTFNSDIVFAINCL